MATKSAKKGTSSGKGAGQKGGNGAPPKAPSSPFLLPAIGSVVLLVAVFSLLAVLGMDAVLLNWLGMLQSGLVGYTQVLIPFALGAVGVELFLYRQLPHLPLKITCTLLLPLWISAMFHTFINGATFQADLFSTVRTLWLTGLAGSSGGLLGGTVASVLVLLVSRVGSILMLLLALFLTLVGLLGSSLVTSIIALIPPPSERKPKARRARPPKRAAKVDAPSVLQAKQSDENIPPEGLEPPSPSKRLSNLLPFLHPKAEKSSAPQEAPPLFDAMNSDERGIPSAPAIPDPKPAAPAPRKPELELDDPHDRILDLFRTGEDSAANGSQEPRAGKNGSRSKRRAPSDGDRSEEGDPITPIKQQASGDPFIVSAKNVPSDQDLYCRPAFDLLELPSGGSGGSWEAELTRTQTQLSDTIHSFGIDAEIVGRTRGPSVTRFELKLEQGVKLSTVTNLSNDLALSLGAPSVRIAPIPGQRSVVGIEVPNLQVAPVPLREVLDSEEFRKSKSHTAFAVGRDIANRNVIGDISRLPHVLIAGTTGSGKSVCVNSLLISLLYKSSPKEVRLIMVDPKMVELGVYNGIPHLLIPVVTDPKKAAGALQWAVYEMMRRYKSFSEQGVRDIASFNILAATQDGKEAGLEPMPSIVVVIDELADLMLVARKEVEDSICRVAQMGRAAGMHLVIATQRPSKDVITGLMKANIPSRIAFAVASAIDSRIILDQSGAEKLVGKGDMLFAPLGIDKPMRVQGCLVSDREVAKVVNFIKENSTANYDESVLAEVEENARNTGKSGKGASAMNVTFPEPDAGTSDSGEALDELFMPAVDVILETNMASVSMLQRRLKLGYSRAARLVDQMEEKGIVGPFEGSKPRKVLITKEQWQEQKMRGGQISFDELDMARSMSAAADAESGFGAGEEDGE